MTYAFFSFSVYADNNTTNSTAIHDLSKNIFKPDNKAKLKPVRSLNNSNKLFLKLDRRGNKLNQQEKNWLESGSEKDSTQWSCIQDLKTGLVWEVKTDGSKNSRHHQLNYTWYSNISSANGGSLGAKSEQDCNGVACDTQSYQTYLNSIKFCGKNNWQLPTVLQFQTIVDNDSTPIAMDTHFFPLSHNSHYWTRQSYAPNRTHAWYLYFSDGSLSHTLKDQPMFLRLVSSKNKKSTNKKPDE